MSEDNKTSTPVSSDKRRARRLKLIAIFILSLGIIGAGIVYRLGVRSQDSGDDVFMLGFEKPEMQQMERLYGKSGDLVMEWSNDLKQPGTQAILIVIFSALVAGGCFYFARLLNNDN